MADDLTQPALPPHDALQRLLDFINVSAIVFTFLWLPILLLITGLVTLFFFDTAFYLIHAWLAMNALLFLREILVGVLLIRSPLRLSPRVVRSFARPKSVWPGRPGTQSIWIGGWLTIFFCVEVAVVPWPPLPHSMQPIMFPQTAVLLLFGFIASAPVSWRLVSELVRTSRARWWW